MGVGMNVGPGEGAAVVGEGDGAAVGTGDGSADGDGRSVDGAPLRARVRERPALQLSLFW